LLSFALIATIINAALNINEKDQQLDSDKKYQFEDSTIVLTTGLVVNILCICFPKFTTPLLMVAKVLYSMMICYLNISRFSSLDVCDKPLDVQIKHLETIKKI